MIFSFFGCITICLLVHLFTGAGSFHLLATVHSAAVNMRLHVSVFDSLGCISRSGIAGSYGIFDFLRN